MKKRPFVAVVLLVVLSTAAAAQTRRALLIGINTYEPPGTTPEHPAGCIYGRCELGSFENLQGSVNDAVAMADLLTSPRFGFPAANVALLTNPAPQKAQPGVAVLAASDTTHDGILAAMKKYLVDLPQPGDTVVFYDASHGSLRINSKGTKLTVVVAGKTLHADSTLVPSDAYKGGYDVRDREMTRIFNAALDKGVHVVAIFDSCHSGASTRGLTEYRSRSLAFDPRDIAEAPDTQTPAPTERANNPALVFAAVQQDQQANESGGDGAEAHGAFTAALIEALEALPANAPASLVYRRVRAMLEANGVPNQEPDLDATAARRQQPLFGDSSQTGDDGRLKAAALQTNPDGSVWLDVGRVAGIGVGTTFEAAAQNAGDPGIELRVRSLEGMTRSTVEVMSPNDGKVAPGQVFELKQWVPSQRALMVWLPPANLSLAQIADAAAQVSASGVSVVADPAEQPWTGRLEWNGSSWIVVPAAVRDASGKLVLDAKAPAPVNLGAPLTAAKLKQSLPANAQLWFDLPPTRELAAHLELRREGAAVAAIPDRAEAAYVLAGTLTPHGPAYAWFHKAEFESPAAIGAAPRHTPGCSTSSSYPVRTAWIPAQHGAEPGDASGGLNLYALRLAKVDGWLQLADTPGAAYADSYYKLALSREPDGPTLAPDQPVKAGDSLFMSLAADAKIVSPRWVYVLDIDCQGNGNLLYPIDYSENRFPNTAGSRLRVPLTGAHKIDVGEPFGIDTIIMLSTEQPLPDPEALNFEGVGGKGTRGLGGSAPPTPLAQLLGDTSSGTRGVRAQRPVPTSWSLDVTQLLSESPEH